MNKKTKDILRRLEEVADPERSRILQGFFKTAPGEYGQGDIFLGISLPDQRKIAREFRDLSISGISQLINSKIHEHRSTALILLVEKYQRGDNGQKKQIFEFYLSHLSQINNWDLVDISCPKIIGDYLFDRPCQLLYNLARSDDLWEKRIAIISTHYFIRNNRFDDSIKISEILIHDQHDLIHKAVGWTLREIGKRQIEEEIKFLDQYAHIMPRTMLRYAIEKFNEEERQDYLSRRQKYLEKSQ
jgi:3-methyladenine DNA glycosylase AlkD